MNDQYKKAFFAEIKGFIEKHAGEKSAASVIFDGGERGLIITPKDVASLRMDEEFLVVAWSDKYVRTGTETRVRFAAITRVDFSPVS